MKHPPLLSLASSILTPTSREPVSQWTERNLTIPPPQTEAPGKLSWHGREYMREFLDSWNVPYVTDLVLCFGSQTGKTTGIMAGVSWEICESPANILWVMPSMSLARSFSTTRWLPMVRASESLSSRIPEGSEKRTNFTTLQQAFGGSVLNFVGSNSPANLSSRPIRVAVLDEVDKFPGECRAEADAVNLAEQRTRKFSNPLRVKCSTPTETDGLIWCEFQKGDQRRYNVPCPLCDKLIVLGWSAQFSLLPIIGNEAWIKWNPDCKRADGTWDLERVATSTWAECPHCHGRISDNLKSKMLRGGKWFPTATATATRGFRSYHLSNLYAVGTQTTWGALAVQFIQAKQSFLGLRGFINGALAEPFERQDVSAKRTERVVEIAPNAEFTVRIMTVDCQVKAPHFWYVLRDWSPYVGGGATSTLVKSGNCETWEDLRLIQQAYGVKDESVTVDSGYGAKSDAEVYRQCARFSQCPEGCVRNGTPVLMGWMPAKGMGSRKLWTVEGGASLPYYVRYTDPFHGTSDAGKCQIMLFEFASEWFKDLLATLRDTKRAEEIGVEWAVIKDAATDEYWRHLDSEYLSEEPNRRTGIVKREWVKRSQRWPNHLLDCEVMQVATAMFYGLLPSIGETK